MPEISRLAGPSGWIDMEFVERERTPEPAMKLGIQSHLAGLSLSNTVSLLENLGVERSRKAVHDWVQKADLQPTDGESPNHVALDETVIRINSLQYWLYAACDPETNQLLHVRLFPTTTTSATQIFLTELREKHSVESAVFLVDGAQHLQTALSRTGLRFHSKRHGNRNAIERIFRELKRRTSSFSNCFSHVFPETAENWLQAFAAWFNAPN
ncbi:IS6 family transposase [Halogeometricum sp. S1BR25-6]|uniref:IS6 family transposase n=1 Tax=Halogeometricum salsisoli TaxID=2950536 RepID=A0ABU2GJD0_9EURY|nr:IS6 family transposase [Halogeometricum sp. S1BR25-6]MDS0300915.1 IS6 family transposase [Halogeometricum sp. S1BR25-6]